MEIFWDSIADYNAATWPYQIGFAAVATFLAVILYFRPSTWAKIATKVFMVVESLWIAFVYYMKFGGVREYSNVMTIFWCLVAAAWIYDLATHFSSFQKSGKRQWLGILMLLMTLCYPLVSIARGMEFPGIATPLLPSGVALYMLGMQMTFSRKINFFAFIFMVHWAIIAISKVVFLNIPEDMLLAAACIPAIYLFFRDAINAEAGESKPSPAAVKALVFGVAAVICICMIVEICLN